MSDLKQTYKTTCSYCGVGCGIEITSNGRDRFKLSGDQDHPVNKGMLCSKGMNLHYTVLDRSDRLLYPHMRGNKGYPLEKTTWDTAMQRAARVFKTLLDRHGPDSVGFSVSGQCLTDEYYLVNKLVKGFLCRQNGMARAELLLLDHPSDVTCRISLSNPLGAIADNQRDALRV